MSLASNQTPQPSADVAALASRMGAIEYETRLQLELALLEQQGRAQATGIWSLHRHFDLYAWIRRALKCCGLWARARRNYFDLQVVQNTVRLPALPEAFEGYTLLQLSDLHADLDPDFPEAVRRRIADLDYDAVVITGDFRTCTFGDPRAATQAAAAIVADVEAPVYGTLGNHDFLSLVPALEAAGIRFLLNESVELRREGASIYLVGIDDPNFYKSHNFSHALQAVPAAACKLLLSHSPQTYRRAAALGFDLLLAGHTHGGQLCLPKGFVLVHDKSAPRHLLSGAWREGSLQGYTSRGTGATGLTARLNCPAEVTLHTLRRA